MNSREIRGRGEGDRESSLFFFCSICRSTDHSMLTKEAVVHRFVWTRDVKCACVYSVCMLFCLSLCETSV